MRQKRLVVDSIPLIGFTILLIGSLSTLGFANSAQETPFNYDPAKIEPGTMYVYEHFTSSEQVKPEGERYYFIKSATNNKVQIEGLEIGQNKIHRTSYTLNMKYMMIESFSFQSLQEKESLPVDSTWRLSFSNDFQRGTAYATFENKYEDGIKAVEETYDTKNIPTFFYYFRNVAFWTAMRFYPYPEKRMDVWNYTGKSLNGVKVEYQGEKTVEVLGEKILSHKFEMSSKGILSWLFGKKAWVWISAENNKQYMVRYKNNNATGNWPMLEYRLSEVKKISGEEWKSKVDKADKREQ